MADSASHHEPFDTDQQQLGTLYAKALLGAAGDDAGQVLEEFDSLIDDVLSKLPGFYAVLSSPRVPPEDKERMLDRAFADKMSSVLLRFLKVCCRRRRLDCLNAMRRAARKLYNERLGRLAVSVSTAAPLEAGQLESLQQRLSQLLGGDVQLAALVDPQLVGGLVVRVGDTVFDGSVANRLQRFREFALQRTAQTVRTSIDRFTTT